MTIIDSNKPGQIKQLIIFCTNDYLIQALLLYYIALQGNQKNMGI